MKRLRLGLAVALAAVAAGPGSGPAHAEECPAVAYKVEAIAAPQANSLVQGTEVLVPVAYSLVEHETEPAFVYAEAGSSSLGALEDQSNTPPGRTASGYPAESLPAKDEDSWGAGTSRTEAGAERGFATADSGPGSGGASRIESVLDCDRVEIDLRWSARGMELDGGGSIGQVTQTARVVLGPEGKPEVEVDTVVADAALGLSELPGQVPDDVARDFFAAGGQELDIQDPVVEVRDGFVHLRSRMSAVRFGQPDGSQGIEVRGGYMELTAERLGALPPFTGGDDGDFGTVGPGTSALPDLPGDGLAPASGATGAVAAEDVEEVAVDTVEVRAEGEIIDFVRSGDTWWWLAVLAMALVALGWWKVADLRRDRWPTADWTLTQLERAGRRFRTTYLQW